MTHRQKKIWDLLMEHGQLTSGQIAKLLHISDRTVRTDIKEINQERQQEVIQAVKGQGYSIRDSVAGLNAAAEGEIQEEDLEWQIVRRLLFDGETPYLELADECYISDTHLSKLVNRINREMSLRYDNPKGVIFKRSGQLVLDLKEQEKREYYYFYVASRTFKHYFDLKEYQRFFEYADLEQIRMLMLEELQAGSYSYYDTTIMHLILHTAVVAERWFFGCMIPVEGLLVEPVSDKGTAQEETEQRGTEQGETEQRESRRRKIEHRETEQKENTQGEAQQILDRLRTMVSPESDIPDEEYRDYERVFQNDFYYEEDGDPEQTRELLHRILIEINVEYGFDFSGNQEFCDEMAAQLNGTLLRARKKQHVVNPVLGEIKSKYPLEYDIAIFFADRFHRLTGIGVSEDEIGQFTVHFIWGMESGFENMQQKLVLINPYGKQINELMEKRLGKTAECHPTIAYEYSIFDYPMQMPKDAVAVLSTIPLSPLPEDIPVVLCRNFLDYHEKEKLLTIIRESQVSNIKSYFRTLFKPSLFFTDMEFESREAALSFMCGKLMEEGYVEQGFFESVMQREHIAPTAFEPGFAFSHGMENNAYRTAVCTCILKNKISWGSCQVKIVFLFALASSWNHTIIPVYNVMIDHLFQSSTIHKLAKIKDCGKFLDLLL